jgi:NADH:ubiquinone oxidoreductase subunit 5 (subunit L)/multisubunit Na+/H+ antiporter MnhA subunit
MDEPSADGLFKGFLFLGVGSVRHKSGSQRKDGDYHEEKNDGNYKIFRGRTAFLRFKAMFHSTAPICAGHALQKGSHKSAYEMKTFCK